MGSTGRLNAADAGREMSCRLLTNINEAFVMRLWGAMGFDMTQSFSRAVVCIGGCNRSGGKGHRC